MSTVAGTETVAPLGGGRDSDLPFASAIAAAGTKIAAFAIPLLILASTDSVSRTVAAAGTLTVFYALSRLFLHEWIAQIGARTVAATADLTSIAVLIGYAAGYQRAIAVPLVLAAVTGALRGVADLAHDSAAETAWRPGTRTRVPVIASVACGVAAGAVVTLVGTVAMVWLPAIAFAASAAMTGWSTSSQRSTTPAADVARVLQQDTQELALYRSAYARRIGLRSTLIACALQNAGQAGALAIVLLWVRGLLVAPAALGLVGGAFVAGAFGGCVAAHAGARAIQTAAAMAVGFAAGAVPSFFGTHLPGMTILIAGTAFVAGTVFTIRPLRSDVVVDYAGAPQEQVVSANVSATVAFVGLPLAALVGALIVEHLPLVTGLLISGGLYLVATGIPLMQRSAPPAETDEPVVAADPLAARLAGVATWVAVTLVYAEGGWTVEVERKEGVSEGGHEVKSTDALRAIDILDLPGLREELEQAIADDQARAEQETQRLRDELGGVDERLSAIREMVEWSEMWRASR